METVANAVLPQKIVVRPWQGTFLGVLNVLGLVLLGIGILLMLGTLLMGSSIDSDFLFIGGLGAIMLIPAIPFVVLAVFMTIGIFKGQKWTVILTAIFCGLGILSALMIVAVFSIAINVFLMYLAIMCIKDPFYNKR